MYLSMCTYVHSQTYTHAYFKGSLMVIKCISYLQNNQEKNNYTCFHM